MSLNGLCSHVVTSGIVYDYKCIHGCNQISIFGVVSKSLHLVFSFNGCEEGVNIIEQYDRQSLYPMPLKCYYYLFLMEKSKVECANQIKDVKFDLNFFEQNPITNEPTTKLISKEMLIFMCYQVDSKEL